MCLCCSFKNLEDILSKLCFTGFIIFKKIVFTIVKYNVLSRYFMMLFMKIKSGLPLCNINAKAEFLKNTD